VKSLALAMLLASSGLATIANADDYGCKVLLCLANPNGPKAVSECVDPINRLYDDLRHGRGFPRCDMANAPSGKAYATTGTNWFNDCPTGTGALAPGAYAVQGGDRTQYYQGIGTGEGGVGGQKVCVGNRTGFTQVAISSGSDNGSYNNVDVGIYDRVVVLNPASSPNYIDVIVNGTRSTRVRW